jgi:hypothetical protein
MRIPALFLVFSLFAPLAFGQTNKTNTSKITLGGETLVLGMAKDEVLVMLASANSIKQAGNENLWGVDSKPPYSNATPFTVIGEVGFESGVLTYVSKRLFEIGEVMGPRGHTQTDRSLTGTSFARAYEAIVTQFVAEEGTSRLFNDDTPRPAADCLVWTEAYDLIGNEIKRVVMQCGTKLLQMEWNRQDDGEDVIIDESMGNFPRLK